MIERTLSAARFLGVALLLPIPVAAQAPDPIVAPYPSELCASCAEWNEPHRAVHIFGNSYYVGTAGVGALLIASPEGHVLLDGGLPDSAPLIIENVRSLGFDIGDVRLIVNSHAHFDHAGGVEALRRASGARVAASHASAPVLETGRAAPADPQFGVVLDFPPVAVVERFSDGDTLVAGGVSITAHLTPGHAPGGTTWSWRSCEGEVCLDLVYADSQTPVSADDFRFTGNSRAIEAFESGFDLLESLPCDLLVTPHPVASAFWERMDEGGSQLIDPDGCRRYAAFGRRLLAARLRNEAESAR